MDYDCRNLSEECLVGRPNASSSEVGAKLDICFNMVLTSENSFKVIPERKDHDAH